ncbi:MAG TPA: tetratricopeptide repeat protein, partial [Usitatibacter sp.]|nr:tetratricopeptide repeat protein [Usitatibacter sp.]
MAAPRALTAEQAMAQAAALFGRGDLAGAQVLCEAILRGDPRHFWALHLAATIALREERFADCVALAGRALEREPTHPDVLCNRGAALRHLNRIEEALADYDRALAGQPRSAVACNNRGVALAALNRHREAVESYSQALRIQPGYSSARFHRGLSLLTLGDLERGLEDYEARGDVTSALGPHRPMRKPPWNGREAVGGKSILLHAEQGLGDTLQFARYARILKDQGATVILEAHPPLTPLLADVQGVDRCVAVGEALPAFDLHCPLASVPRAVGTRIETIPGGVPYVAAPAGHVERWRGLLGPRARPLI